MPNGDLELYESYMKGVSKTGTSKKDREKIDEGITSGLDAITKYVNGLTWKEGIRDPSNKKMALRVAGQIQMHINELVQGIIDMETLIGDASQPGFEKLVRDLIRKNV